MRAWQAAFGKHEGDKPTASLCVVVVPCKQAALRCLGKGARSLSQPAPWFTAGCGYEPALGDGQATVWS